MSSSLPNIPPGWASVSDDMVSSLPPKSILFKHAFIGLYDTEKDLRHFGEGEIILTETKIILHFPDVKKAPELESLSASSKAKPHHQHQHQLEFIGAKHPLNIEMQLSLVESYKWMGGFAMFSSPKVQLTLKKMVALPRISFRNGGIEDFVKHLETSLKKRAWLEQQQQSTAAGNASTYGQQNNNNNIAAVSNTKKDNNGGKDDSVGFATRKAGIAGVLASQTERTNQLRETIKSSTGEVDSLILKSKELQSLMDRFKEEVAKGDYKLCGDQIDQLKKLDARFSITSSSSTSTSNNGTAVVNALLLPEKKNDSNTNDENQYSSSTTTKEISKDLVKFVNNDSVISCAVRVPLIELYSAFNTARGFGSEIEPPLFHEAVCELVKNYPEKRVLSLIITNKEISPSFALHNDHLVQCHVLAKQLKVLEQGLGTKPFFTLGFKLDESQVKKYKSISVLQCSRLLKMPVDETREVLHQLEVAEGVLLRDEHPSVGIRFSWNLMCVI